MVAAGGTFLIDTPSSPLVTLASSLDLLSGEERRRSAPKGEVVPWRTQIKQPPSPSSRALLGGAGCSVHRSAGRPIGRPRSLHPPLGSARCASKVSTTNSHHPSPVQIHHSLDGKFSTSHPNNTHPIGGLFWHKNVRGLRIPSGRPSPPWGSAPGLQQGPGGGQGPALAPTRGDQQGPALSNPCVPAVQTGTQGLRTLGITGASPVPWWPGTQRGHNGDGSAQGRGL